MEKKKKVMEREITRLNNLSSKKKEKNINNES